MELRDQEVTASTGFMHAPPRAACWRRGVAPLPSQHPSLCVELNSSLVCEAADGLGLSAVTQNSLGIWSACQRAGGLRWQQWEEELVQSEE